MIFPERIATAIHFQRADPPAPRNSYRVLRAGVFAGSIRQVGPKWHVSLEGWFHGYHHHVAEDFREARDFAREFLWQGKGTR